MQITETPKLIRLFTSHTSSLPIHLFLRAVNVHYPSPQHLAYDGHSTDNSFILILKSTLFDVCRISWKEVSQGEWLSVIVLKNFDHTE